MSYSAKLAHPAELPIEQGDRSRLEFQPQDREGARSCDSRGARS